VTGQYVTALCRFQYCGFRKTVLMCSHIKFRQLTTRLMKRCWNIREVCICFSCWTYAGLDWKWRCFKNAE